MILRQLSIFIIVMSSFYACSNQHGQNNQQLLQAAVQEVNTDSAFHLLSSVETKLLNDRDFAAYTILRVRLKDKMGQDISEDTLAFKAKDYLMQVNDPFVDIALYVTANVYTHRGDNMQAINNYLEAANKTDDNLLKSFANFNIARMYCSQGEYKQSLEFLNKTDRCYQVANVKDVDRMHSLELRALNYLYLNRLDNALKYFNEAEEFALLDNDNQNLLRIIQNTSFALCEAHEYERAKEKCIKAISLVREDDYETLGKLQIVQSRLYIHASEYDSASVCISKAYELLKDTGNDMIEIYRLFSSIEEGRGNYKQAWHYNQLHSNAKEAANERRIKYQNANQDSSFQKIQQERDDHLKSKSNSNTVIFFLGLTLLLALLVVAFYIKKERFRERFKEQKNQFSNFQKNTKIEKAKLERELDEIQKERAKEQALFQQEKMLAIEFRTQTNQEKIEAENEIAILQAELTELKEKAENEKVALQAELTELKEKAKSEIIALQADSNEFKEKAANEKIALQAELTEFKEKSRKEKEACEKEININRRLCNEERIRLMNYISDIGKLQEILDARKVELKDIRRQMKRIIDKLDFEGIYPVIDHFYQGNLGRLKIDFPQLSEPENRLFVLACAGFKSREIGIILDKATSHSVSTQKTNLRGKLELRSRTDFQNFFIKRYGITEAFF